MAFWYVSPRGVVRYGKVLAFWGRQKCLESKNTTEGFAMVG